MKNQKPKYVVLKDGFVKFTSDSFESAQKFYDSLRLEFPESSVVFRF